MRIKAIMKNEVKEIFKNITQRCGEIDKNYQMNVKVKKL